MQNKELQMFISAAFAGLLYYLGIVAVPIIILICAMIIDYATGMMAACYNSELSSKKGIKGIVKKVGHLALVLASMIIDWLISQGLQQVNIDIKYSVFFAVIVAIWLIINGESFKNGCSHSELFEKNCRQAQNNCRKQRR